MKTFMQSPYLANAMALIVLVDALCTCADIDAKAARKEPSDFVVITGDMCLAVYTLEALLLLCLFGIRVLRDWMTLMDISIVACGWAEAALEIFGVGDSLFRLGIVRALRLVRIFRLIRLVRRIRAFRELHKLVMMMSTCMKTLAWSFLLCFVVMTVWAMLMVEIVHPTVRDMQKETGFFDNCPWCQTATSSVMDANLLLFKTVVAGDSWGEIAVPVIQKNPATLFIFVGSLLTLVFGVLNVIVAVVVDTFADARQRDVQNLADELDDDILADKKDLQKIFDRIDVDGSGQLTLEELIAGARSDPMFQSRLRVMDIDENDLTQLFGMIDSDGSGTIEVAEFLGPLSRWAHDSKTAPRFIKYNLLQSINLQEDLYDMSSMSFSSLAQKIDDLQSQFQSLRMQITQKAVAEKMEDGTFDSERVSTTLSMEAMRSINSASSAMMPLSLPEKSVPAKSMPSKDVQEFKQEVAVNSELESASKVEMPHASKDVPLLQASHQHRLESRMEATIARIEARLEGLWQLSLRPTPLPALPATLPPAMDDSSGSLHSGKKTLTEISGRSTSST